MTGGGTIRPPWVLCNHAWHRCAEMGVTRRDVLEVLRRPEVTYPAGVGRVKVGAGSLLLVIEPCTRVVITVLWKTTEPYERAA